MNDENEGNEMGKLINFNTAARQLLDAEGDAISLSPNLEARKELQDREKEAIKARMAENPLHILQYLFPSGRLRHKEFLVGSIAGEPGKSLSINTETGVWSDFAAGIGGGDFLDLWMSARNCDFPECVRQVKEFYGMDWTPPKLKTYKENKPLPPPTATWYYKDASGETVLVKVTRYDYPDGTKEFRPHDAIRGKAGAPEVRPLYNLHGVSQSQHVVLVEGEKCAEALINLGICATTAMSGANTAITKTDWAPLSGRNVLIWPDNDEPGMEYARRAFEAIKAAEGFPSVLPVPPGKPDKWDAADAVTEGFDVVGFLEKWESSPAKPQYRIKLSDWSKHAYSGEAPEREWLVDHVFPIGSLSILAAAGGSGKGMLGLHMALQVVCDFTPDLLNQHPKAFGNNVLQHGTAVIFSAEDDRGEIHRRLNEIDPDNRRFVSKHDLIIIPLPNSGGPAPLVTPGKNGLEVTSFFKEIREQLLAIENLKMIVFDPLSNFALCDLSASRVDANFTLSTLSSLATDTNTAVIAIHHLNKFKTDRPITTPEQAKASISGSAGVVDGSRVSYCIWPMETDEAKRKCRRLGIDYERDKVFAGAVVKANCPVDKSIKTFVRCSDNGLLYVMDDALRNAKTTQDDLIEAMIDVVRRGALAGRPFTVSSRKETSFHDRKEELPIELQDIGRNRLHAMLNELIESQKIKKCVAQGSKSAIWLDIPGGPFFNGAGMFEPGFVEI